jgi:hypothetical protein
MTTAERQMQKRHLDAAHETDELNLPLPQEPAPRGEKFTDDDIHDEHIIATYRKLDPVMTLSDIGIRRFIYREKHTHPKFDRFSRSDVTSVTMTCSSIETPPPFAQASEGTLIETDEQANAAHSRVMNSKEDAIGLGRFLTKKQAEVGHGNWIKYVEDKLDFSIDTAQRYLKIYKHRAQMPHACGFSIRSALKICDRVERKTRRQAVRKSVLATVLTKLIQKYSIESLIVELEKLGLQVIRTKDKNY